jgi:hypothetical protein
VDASDGGEMALFWSANGSVIEGNDPGGISTVACGTNSSNIVCWSSGTNSYRIDDRQGRTKYYSWIVIGK